MDSGSPKPPSVGRDAPRGRDNFGGRVRERICGVSLSKTDKRIEMPFAAWTRVGLAYESYMHVINVRNVYQKFLINAFVIFVNVYYFNKGHMKCRKS